MNMNVLTAKIITIVLSTVVVVIVVFALVYKYIIKKRVKKQTGNLSEDQKPKEKVIRHRPKPLKLDHIRYQRLPSQYTPLVITPTTPSHFTIPTSRLNQEEGRSDSKILSTSPDCRKAALSPSAMLGIKTPGILQSSPKLLRTMSEGHSSLGFEMHRVPPHGKIECFLKYEKESNSLLVQILGKKGHSLRWLTGISNPYIRVSLINSDTDAIPTSSSKILNLPSNPSCNLDGITDENLKDCLLKFVVLDFDRFSRSEFVAEVVVHLGVLGDLQEGVTICEELMLQQKVMLAPRGSLLISLCNQCVAQQLQVIILKADGIPIKSAVSFPGSDIRIKTTLETSEACHTRKTKGIKKNNSYIFNEKLVFEVTTEMLTDAKLSFEVMRGDSKLRYETKIGVIKLGLDSSQALEMRHWSEMLASPQKQIAEWHQLRRL